ncbi:prepilin-type N-terminal cleavage/methylation domain-containing protein [Acinetobacter halotolerans]|uniref:Prepilin-type N-terminal cleavage/methylation domain-containing protein n=1 Tax=Acinetobacter halotolerans TaxID=1752076 RepID=A0A4V2DBD5_9GAMM|nr:GspH/FimT family pseudopilin [Acinetobacter halotolerans]RZF56936.1 prepilin-type N-terminal cleavage/methylation domain-containing protein [Acinetobacter halotolerans]
MQQVIYSKLNASPCTRSAASRVAPSSDFEHSSPSCAQTKLHFIYPHTQSTAFRLSPSGNFEHSSSSCAQTKLYFVYPRSGFTLFELIVTITIIAILAVMAAPSFASIYSRQKLESSAREVAMKVSEARAQAVMLRESTGVCLSSLSETNCSTALTITDTNKNRIFVAHLDKGVTVDSRSETYLKFRNNGSVAAATNFILLRNGFSYCIAVGITGDTTIKEGACT